MAEIEPAVGHFSCPYPECEGFILDLVIPVMAIEGPETGHISFRVVEEDIDVQPFWDHALKVHGPKLDLEGPLEGLES